MSVLDRLSRKASTLSAADAEQIATAVAAAVAEALAGHPKQAMPTAAPQSHRVRALLRSVHAPALAPERPTAPAPAPARPMTTRLTVASPFPDAVAGFVTETPRGPVTTTFVRDDAGQISACKVGAALFEVRRGLDGRISAITSGDYVSRIKRDAAGKMVEFTAEGIPPCWWK